MKGTHVFVQKSNLHSVSMQETPDECFRKHSFREQWRAWEMIAFEGDVFQLKLKGFILEYYLRIKFCGKHVLVSRTEDQTQRNDKSGTQDWTMPTSGEKEIQTGEKKACTWRNILHLRTRALDCLTWSGRLFLPLVQFPNMIYCLDHQWSKIRGLGRNFVVSMRTEPQDHGLNS